MTKPKSAPEPVAQAPAADAVTSPTDAVAAAEADRAEGKEVSVTSTGRVQVTTNIKVEDFTEGGEPAPDVYSRKPKVEKVDLGDGRFVEHFA